MVATGRARAGAVVLAAVVQAEGPLGEVLRSGDAMKSNIHPDYHRIKVVMTDGAEYFTHSTYGAEGDTLVLDIDPRTHPAWTGGQQQILDRGGRVSRFKNKFGGFLG